MNPRRFRGSCLVLVSLIASAASPAPGEEIVVKNDSMTDASSVTPCICFTPGDIPAAWLTSPVPGKIVGVQVFWRSGLGGAPDTQETAIRIYDGGTFPTPGSVLQNDGAVDAEVVAPLLSDGVLNEFRFLDQAETIPLSVPVSKGQVFAVGLEIFNQSSGGGSFTPSLPFDTDGCESDASAVFVFDQNDWFEACGLGTSGDWVIRAIIEWDSSIPATSHWGLAVLALVLLTAGTVVTLRHGKTQSPLGRQRA